MSCVVSCATCNAVQTKCRLDSTYIVPTIIMSTTTQAYLQAPTPKASTTSVISNSALNLNWLLRFAGYAGALPPTYTAPPTASSHIAGMETAEAVAAAVADIVDGVAAGQYQSPDARIVTAADALASSMGGAEGSVAAATGGGGFSWGSRGNRGFRGVGSVFNYLTSSWALLCIFMVYKTPQFHPWISSASPLTHRLLKLGHPPQPHSSLRFSPPPDPPPLALSPPHPGSSDYSLYPSHSLYPVRPPMPDFSIPSSRSIPARGYHSLQF